jgi:hypothetical protein
MECFLKRRKIGLKKSPLGSEAKWGFLILKVGDYQMLGFSVISVHKTY